MRFSKALKIKSQRTNAIAFDIDGTIAEYDGNYQEGVLGAPISATVETMKLLKDRGFDIMKGAKYSPSEINSFYPIIHPELVHR